MGTGKLTENIAERQNEEKMLRLLHASAVAYGRAKLGENLVTLVLLMLSVAYPVCYIFILSDDVKMALFACSFLLTIIVMVYGDRFKGNTTVSNGLEKHSETPGTGRCIALCAPVPR